MNNNNFDVNIYQSNIIKAQSITFDIQLQNQTKRDQCE